MRRFLVHALAFIALQAMILELVRRGCPDDPNHYMAATIDKHERLRAAASPRVIFVGGSSVGFSVDSRPFAALGFTPVNMGLNDGLGLDFMLREVESQLRPGDLVIVAPEPHLYWTGSQHDSLWAVLEQRPASAACLGPRSARELSDQALHFLARKVRCAAHQISTQRPLPTIYRRDSFDETGDFSAHRALAAKHEAPIDRPWPAVDTLRFDHAISALQRFAGTCEARAAVCTLAWCPLRHAQLEREAELLRALEARLEAEVALPLIETLAEAGHPPEAFYDRGPHLTGAAAQRRSARLAARAAALRR